MLTRRKFTWKCVLANVATGATREETFTSYWDPETTSLESVAQACAAMFTVAEKKKYAGVSAELLPA
jgi:hypothetical protein